MAWRLFPGLTLIGLTTDSELTEKHQEKLDLKEPNEQVTKSQKERDMLEQELERLK